MISRRMANINKFGGIVPGLGGWQNLVCVCVCFFSRKGVHSQGVRVINCYRYFVYLRSNAACSTIDFVVVAGVTKPARSEIRGAHLRWIQEGFKGGGSVEAPEPDSGGDSVRILGVCPAVTLTFGP